MFGPDTPLVWDAIQIAGLAAVAGAGAIWLVLRRRKAASHGEPVQPEPKTDLEDRVRVLERIATDRPAQRAAALAEEIESLRSERPAQELEGETR